MPRTAEFDRDRAIDAAMRLFWVRGYSATSMAQLLDAMAIGRGSFYAAFGSKQALFSLCLQRFSDRTRRILVDARTDAGPLEAIAAFFRQTALDAPRHRVARGCMMVNSVLELADVEPALSAEAAAGLDKIEAEFAACFRDAQQRGELHSARTPEALAAAVMLINQGLRVASRTGAGRDDLQQNLNTTLGLLGIAA